MENDDEEEEFDFDDAIDYPEVEDGGFIPGIYNYCDRWCERCTMSAKCRQYATEALADALYGEESQDPENEAFWNRLAIYLGETRARLDEMREQLESFPPAEPMGEMFLTVEDEDLEDIEEDEEDEAEEWVDQQPCSLESRRYIDQSRAWFDANEARLAELGVDLQTRSRREGVDLSEGPNQLGEACEVVAWYQFQIHVKLQRALSSRLRERSYGWERSADEDWPLDSDGSAKVALIGIDRSLAAWGVMLKRMPEQEAAILEILICLDGVRRLAERAFPEARRCRRPGFDD